MKNMVDEFKDFINKGDVVTIAVGLILALYFQKIVEALLDGVINPIIAGVFAYLGFKILHLVPKPVVIHRGAEGI